PRLTMQDGPAGLSAGDRGVTQLPAPLGVAASFDTTLAYDYGQVEGAEAHAQGIDAVQGPNLGIDRVPEAGRAFEGYGEDPFLVSAMGVADVEGIQSEGVMADAKHFAVYTQETDRHTIDQIVGARALAEIYLRPFQAVVQQAHVASIMCAYGLVDGVPACSDAGLFHVLFDEWHFRGFVRSDLGATTAPIRSFVAGLDAVKPAATAQLRTGVADHQLTAGDLDRAARRVLSAMFAYHLVLHPLTGRPGLAVDSPAHAAFALRAAEESMVLLKDSGRLLPLSGPRAVAVIGVDAAGAAMTAGFGSARVAPPFVSTPLAALRQELGPHAIVRYAPGASGVVPLRPIPASYLAATSTVQPVNPPVVTAQLVRRGHAGLPSALDRLARSGAAATGSIPNAALGELAHWSATLTVPHSGLYTVSLADSGDTWLAVGGQYALVQRGESEATYWTVALALRKGVHYPVRVTWFPQPGRAAPSIGLEYDTPAIARAAALARASKTAVVFVSDRSGEAWDRPTLSLPGDENALVSAVARANPRTVVVLNTAGPVLMPWLSKVAAVVEAWYPGEQDGRATAAVLTGRYDPAGRLPVTFPVSQAQTPVHTLAEWPGVGGAVHLSEDLDVGYRYYDAHHLTPLFPFGYGLDYTTFALSDLSVTRARGAVTAHAVVTNTGGRTGTEVVEAYLQSPAAAGEPPLQLKAFARVTLAAGRSATTALVLPRSAFESYLHGRWMVPPGHYVLHVGTSSADLPLTAVLDAPG
ncbi:MAG: glycoside hydrolase family 3 protein, partial [Acidimicrobiales bacterium]